MGLLKGKKGLQITSMHSVCATRTKTQRAEGRTNSDLAAILTIHQGQTQAKVLSQMEKSEAGSQ